MTFRELYEKEYADKIERDNEQFPWYGCPCNYYYDPPSSEGRCPSSNDDCDTEAHCTECWNREVPEETLAKLKKDLNIVSPSTGKVPDIAEPFSMKYQERVDVIDDMRKLYERVITYSHVKQYRGYTEMFSYGWDPTTGTCIKKEGEFWFENPGYNPATQITCRNESERGSPLAAQMIETIIKKEEQKPRILDSGNRRQFETGAVRDICEGKGRCDLLPLDVVAMVDQGNGILGYIGLFQDNGDIQMLINAIRNFTLEESKWDCREEMLLEVAKHFEEGCKKYGDNNWQKGIPTRCYVDSAVRHYLKYKRGDKDEPHDRAFCWNIMCCIWTCIHKPELNDYNKKEG